MIIGPVPPFVPIIGTIGNQQKQASVLRANDQLIQQTECQRVVPMQVLEDRDDRLNAALAQQQAVTA